MIRELIRILFILIAIAIILIWFENSTLKVQATISILAFIFSVCGFFYTLFGFELAVIFLTPIAIVSIIFELIMNRKEVRCRKK